MALLDFGSGAQAGGGLLSGDPQHDQFMKMALFSSMFKRKNGNGGGMFANMMPMMLQMQQAQRQQATDAMRMKEHQNSMYNAEQQKQKYQRELDDYNQKKQAEKDLLNTINGGGEPVPQQAPAPEMPAPSPEAMAAPQINPLTDPKNMQASLQTMLPPALAKGFGSQPQPQAQAPQQQPQPPIETGAENKLYAGAAQNALDPGLQAPTVPTEKDLHEAFASVKPADSSGNVSQGALQKRKIATHLMNMGQHSAALNLLKSNYGQPIAVANEKGQPTYIQINDDGEVRELPNYKPIPKKGTVVRDANGNVIFEQGGWQEGGAVSPTNSTQSELQKSVVGFQDQLNRLDQVAKDHKSSYLTYPGQARSTFAKYANKVTGKSYDKDYLQGRTKFNNGVEQLFNMYRKEITGAAASVQELDRLKTSMLNVDQSPDEFEASYSQFKSLVTRSMQLKQQFLGQGIPLGSPQMGQMIDDALLSGKQPTDDNSSPAGQGNSEAPKVRRFNPQTGRIE